MALPTLCRDCRPPTPSCIHCSSSDLCVFGPSQREPSFAASGQQLYDRTGVLLGQLPAFPRTAHSQMGLAVIRLLSTGRETCSCTCFYWLNIRLDHARGCLCAGPHQWSAVHVHGTAPMRLERARNRAPAEASRPTKLGPDDCQAHPFDHCSRASGTLSVPPSPKRGYAHTAKPGRAERRSKDCYRSRCSPTATQDG